MRPEHRLTLDASTADFAVDVANVVRNTSLGGERGADLGRLLDLLDALAAFHRDESVQVYCVTDRSLMTDVRLTARERETLGHWYADGLLEVLPVADDRLVELASATRLRVVTDDNFLDYYRRHPWLPGDRHHFLRAVAGPGGSVRVQPRIMPEPQDWQISRKEEESALLAAGLYDRRRGGARQDLLLRRWLCPEPGCPLFGPARTGGQPCPTRRGGSVRCPAHDVALKDIGTRPHQVQLKVRTDGEVRHRFLVVEGTELTVGRAPTVPDGGVPLASHLGEAALHWISRNHVVLELTGRTLTVRDTSANGTRIRRPQGEEVRLAPQVPRRLGRGESIVLHDTVSLELSGRNFVFDAEPVGQEPPDGPGDGRPTAVAREATQPTMLAPGPGIRAEGRGGAGGRGGRGGRKGRGRRGRR
ncbi:FHA domain-containing protein [Streptomyces sp. TP-A0356]|uniref:FHA domain-containing protein n=1 Tax=Streptomyces sp. TP-A0356 TaxID=1359208 RepID=UPI0006E209D5|nr:FHA domain-containing protein [Streptomyces sp. TP-A0356]